MGFSRGPKIVTDGLVLALDAANVKSYPGSGTTWNDLSGNGNNGTLVNGPTFDSGNNGSIVFDGVDDYVNTNNNYNFTATSSFTVSCWVLQKSAQWAGGNGPGYVGKSRASTHSWELGVLDGGDLNWEVRGGGSRVQARGSTPINKYFNAVGVYDNGSIALYIDSILISTETYNTSDGDFNADRSVQIGRRANDGSRVLDGKISNVQIYNRALTSEEVLQNYNATKSRYGL